MSWLSHFTGWVGEKKGTLLPIVTGLAGFAAGMLPGVGGTAQKLIDKLGNKISGGVDMLNQVQTITGGDPAAPGSPAVSAVETPKAPTTAPVEQTGGVFERKGALPTAEKEGVSPLVLVGGGLLALMMLGGSRR